MLGIKMKLSKLIIATSIALAVSACGENESAQSHLIKAKSYISAQQVNESIIELKNALRLEPQNAEVRFLLGQLYLSQGRGDDAVKELERASTYKYATDKVIPLLARAYMLTDADDNILSLADSTISLPNEVQSHYLAYKTIAALRTNNIELAIASVELAQKLSPSTLYTLLAQSYLLLSKKDVEQAYTLVDKMLTIEPNNPDVLMLQAQLATAKEDYKQAVVSYEKYLAVQPFSGIVQLFIADVSLRSGDTEKAEKYADAILAKVSSQPFANYIKAMVRFSAKDYAKASQHAEAAIQGNFNQHNLKLVAGVSAFELQNYEQCHYHLSALVAYLPKDHVARRMLAVSQLKLGLVDEITDTLSGFESTSSEDAAFMSSLSFKLLEVGAVTQAKELSDQTATGNHNAEQSAREGILKLMMNDPSGMDNLKQAINLNPELIEAELALAFAAVQTGDLDQANEISTKWQEKYTDKPGGFNLLAAIHMKKKEFKEAKNALTKSLAISKDDLFALTEMVRIEKILNNDEEAKRQSLAVLALYPNNVKVLRQHFELNQNEMGLDKLKQAHLNDLTSIDHGVLYAEALISLGETEKTIEILNSYEVSAKTPKRYWQLLYGANRKLNKDDNTEKALNKWRQTNPYHLEPIVLLSDALAMKGDYDRALTVLNAGLEQHENNTILKMVKLHILLNSQRVAEAKLLYNTLESENLNVNIRSGIEGRIALGENEYTQAIPKLEVFYKAFPKEQNALYLAAALKGNKELKRTKTLLETYLSHSESDRIRALLASLYLNGDEEKALIEYEKIIKTQPNNIVINNNLAWLYMKNGEHDKAVIHAKKAYELAPKNANVVDTYSQTLLKSGNKRLALDTAENAFKLSDGKDIDILLNYSEVLIANSRNNEAKKLLDNMTVNTDEQGIKRSSLLSQFK